MKNLLNEEQKNYLKGLNSKKKRRKFIIDCLVENLIGERVIFRFSTHQTTTAPRTFEGLGIPNLIKKKMEGCKRIGDRFFKEKHVFKNNDLVFITDTNRVVKSGYVKNATTHDEFGVIVDGDWEPLHIDNLTVCNFSPFAQAENKDELLKFDMLGDFNKEGNENIYRLSLTQLNEEVLKCVKNSEDPTNILNKYLFMTQKYYFEKTSNKIDFIIDLFPQLKNDESANSEKKYTVEDLHEAFIAGETRNYAFRGFLEQFLESLKNDKSAN